MSPLPGSIGVVATNDLGGRIIRLVTKSKVNHAFIVIDDHRLVEARPSGAGYENLSHYPDAIYLPIELTDAQRDGIVAGAKAIADKVPPTGYSWVDIAALSLYVFTGRHVPGWVQQRIENNKRLICSQLCDLLYMLVGVHLFSDSRLPGAVTPGNLIDLYPELAK